MAAENLLRGFIERIEIGRGFLVLHGWAATTANKRIDEPLILRIDGAPEVVVPQLVYRPDLDAAGIADGIGGFTRSIMTEQVFQHVPQVYAFTQSMAEIPISGIGTAVGAFEPVGAFDYIAEEGIGGWLYDPANDGSACLLVESNVRIALGDRLGRPDLPYDFGAEQPFGFFVPTSRIIEALRAAGTILNCSARLTLMSSSRLVAEDVSPWLPADFGKQNGLLVEDQGEPKTLALRVSRLQRAGNQIAVFGTVGRGNGLPFEAGLYFALGEGPEVFVPELDQTGITTETASFAGTFRVIFPLPETADLPIRFSVGRQSGSYETFMELSTTGVRHEPLILDWTVRQGILSGTYLDLVEASRATQIELAVEGKRSLAVPLAVLDEGVRFWGLEGQLATAFQIAIRDVLAFLRGQDPLRNFADGDTISIAFPSAQAPAPLVLLNVRARGIGRLEKAEPEGCSGWLVARDETGDHAEFDVYVNGIRYLTGKADRNRADLIEKHIATSGGGFRFQPSNPDTASRIINVAVAQAFSENYLTGADGRLEIESADRPNLDRLYSVLNTVKRRRVCVIVPIYNAAECLELCLASLVKHTDSIGRILLIDDCSPDPRISEIMAAYGDFTNVSCLHNETNLGFTRTVNRGIALAGDDDVVLLNSDTIVTPGWLHGLKIAAYSGPKVATATAVSNNSGAFSVPEINVDNAYPEGWDDDDFARLVRQFTLAVYPRVPTGNGFCLFIRRDCIEAIGTLDEEAFPVGYGEENDFCMRALRAGYEHVCDDRTFVYHKRSASFGVTRSDHYALGRETLRQRYPEYQRLTAVFESGPDMLGMRWRVRKAIAEYRGTARKPLPRVAFVISTRTGGTPQTNRDLMEALADRYEPWVLRCDSRQIEVFRLEGGAEVPVATRKLRERIIPATHRSSEYNDEMTKLLVLYGFEMVHIRHLAWHGADLPAICQQLGLPVVLSFHDFYSICPSTKLLDENQVFCGGECTPGEGECAVELWEQTAFPALKHKFVHRWREIFAAVFAECSAFVTTSSRARDVLIKNFPNQLNRDFHVIPHGRSFTKTGVACSAPDPSKPLRVLVPGNISPAKGADIIRGIAALDTQRTVEFHILGDAGHIQAREAIVLHGRYERDAFGSIVQDLKPNIGAIFSIWPETYCHTLTELWAAGVPVVGIDIGAVGERMQQHGGGWLLPPTAAPADILALLRGIRKSRSAVREKVAEILEWQNGYGRTHDISYMAAEYDRLYQSVRKQHRSLVNLTKSGDEKRNGVVIEDRPGAHRAAPVST